VLLSYFFAIGVFELLFWLAVFVAGLDSPTETWELEVTFTVAFRRFATISS
jgi:hypothetical protein